MEDLFSKADKYFERSNDLFSHADNLGFGSMKISFDSKGMIHYSFKTKSRRRIKQKRRSLPEEVLEEILVRIPVKSLLRFKSVCKTWRSLIDTRSFIDFYRSRHSHDYRHPVQLIVSPNEMNMDLTVFVTNKEEDFDRLPLPSISNTLSLEMTSLKKIKKNGEWGLVVRTMGPLSNGIYLMISNMQCDGHVSIDTGKIALCNPVTNDYKITNPIPFESNLARKRCRVHYGFGMLDDEHKDYKVIVILSCGARFSSFLSFVYSLNNGTWRKIVDYENGKRHFSSTNGLLEYPEITSDLELCPQRFYKGRWHWMAINADHSCSVLAFDLSNDSFELLGGPTPYYFDHERWREDDYVKDAGALVLNDHLAAIFTSSPCSYIHVWMMMDYGNKESWTKIYDISPNIVGDFCRLIGIISEPIDDGGLAIKKIYFEDYPYMQVISCDDSGFEEYKNIMEISMSICWNNIGISTFMQTLEPL